MEVEIVNRDSLKAAKIKLMPGEACSIEASSMIAGSNDLESDRLGAQKVPRGLINATRRVLTSETFSLRHVKAGAKGGGVWVAPPLPGELIEMDVEREPLIVQGGTFLASEATVDIDLSWQGIGSLISGEGLFWVRLNGSGKALLSTFGSLFEVDVDGEHIVDSGHIVAFSPTLSFTVTKAGRSWLASFLGGEGFVCKFQGKGRVWCQSHNALRAGLRF